MWRNVIESKVFFLALFISLGVVSLLASTGSVIAEVVAVTPLPPVGETDGRAGACYSNYYEHGNRPFLPLVHDTGVRHDRVDFSWATIEADGNDAWNFAPYDELVSDVAAEGIDLVVILQWTPDWAATVRQGIGAAGLPERPLGWYAPTPHARTLNAPLAPSAWSSVPQGLYLPWNDPGNYWGDFVFETVSRYSGTVEAWEIWNEPDGDWGVWDGSDADYAQLLKVGYRAAKSADPDATVLFGGLMYWADETFFERVLDILNDDPTAPANNYFFDVMSVHFYARSSQAYDMVNQVRSRMNLYVPDHPIWLTETGVSVYDGTYAGVRTEYSATETEAAAYLIQSYANAIAANVQRYHWFRTHDGDMPEHFGLTHDETYLRPAYVAYQVAATYLISPTFTTRAPTGSHVRVTLWGTPRGKASVLWNTSPTPGLYTLPAAIDTATLVDRLGVTSTVTATGGVYTFTLPGATANRPAPNENDYIIGGDPLILIESEASNQPPTSTVHSLPAITYSPTFTLTWEGQDNESGVWLYDVQVRDGPGGEWGDLEQSTTMTSTQFTGQHGHAYYFRSRATDRVGNRGDWPADSQAHTEFDLASTLHLSVGAFFADESGDGVWNKPITETGEVTLTQVTVRLLDEAGADVITPTVGSTVEFTTTIYAGQAYRLLATSTELGVERAAYLSASLFFNWPQGNQVYTETYDDLGLLRVGPVYLPLVTRQG